jgi:ribose transport system substrate-binding protein
MMKKTISGMCSVCLMLLILAACGGKSATSGTSAPQVSAGAAAGSGSINDHPIYALTDKIELSGVMKPILNDRSGIKKNLPVAQKKNLVIGWAAPTLSNTYFVGIQKGAQARSSEYGYTLKYLVATDFDVTKMSANIEAFVTEKVDVIVVDPVDVQSQALDIQRAVAAGIPVIASGVPLLETEPVITTIVSNNYEGGFSTGAYCGDYFTGPLDFAIIMGAMGHPVSDSRVCGFLAGFTYARWKTAGKATTREDAMMRGYELFQTLRGSGRVSDSETGMNVVGLGFGNWNDIEGMAAAEDIITANPNIKLIFAENDHMGMGARQALEIRGIQNNIQIASAADGDTKGIEQVRDGKLLTTGYNCAPAIGSRVIDLIHMIFEEGYDANNLPMITGLPVICVTKDNYQEVYDPNSEYAKAFDIPIRTINEINASK